MKISRTAQALGQLAAMLPVLCLTACGRRGELLGTVAPAPDGASPGAGGASTPRFSEPQLVASVSDPLAYDADPSVTGDLLQMFFFSDRSGNRDIWTSRRLSATDPWGDPTAVSELNSPFPEEGPSISLDGRRIWFVTDRDGSGRHIWRSSRSGPNGPWAAPQPVTELAGSGNDLGPSLDAAETTIFFATSRPRWGATICSSPRGEAPALRGRSRAQFPASIPHSTKGSRSSLKVD
jgi:Tol biopolymer transport system component